MLSVIIPCFNYDKYVGQAISSALSLEAVVKEIIVVDDGSTDGSAGIIREFAEANPGLVSHITKPNGGMSSAINVGFAAARGDLVYILDADDTVNPDMMRKVMDAWRPGVSKVQFFLEIMDENGKFVWFNEPPRPTPEEIRSAVLMTGVYPSPPTSGNVYSAEFLRQVMPIDPEEIWSDAYLNLLAPLYGDVISLDRPLGRYRMHDLNMQSATATDITPAQRKHIRQTDLRDAVMERYCQKLGLPFEPGLRDRDYIALSRRLTSRKLRPDLHPISDDRLFGLVSRAVRAISHAEGMRVSQKAVIAVWLTAMAFGPKRLSNELARMRFIPGHRPKALVSLLRLAGAARGTRVGNAKGN